MHLKSTICIAAVAALLWPAMASAQRAAPVTVQNGEDQPVPTRSSVRKIPVTCLSAVVAAGDTSFFECFRVDTGSAVTPVPEGYFLAITDFNVRANSGNQTDPGLISFAIRTTSGPFSERVDMRRVSIGNGLTFHYETPPVWVRPGDDNLRIFGFATNQIAINSELSGYMIREEDIGYD